MKKSSIVIEYLFLLILSMNSCNLERNAVKQSQIASSKSIVILYENDVHCAVEGYTKLAGFRNAINQSDTAQCIIVSCGDYLQGKSWGALSQGEYIVDVMNAVGYSAATLGNHEFDYGVPYLLELMKKCNVPLSCVNFSSMNSSTQYYKPFIMAEVSGEKIAFVGVVTPTTLASEYYSFYDENNTILYNLYPNSVFQLTQQAVNEARSAGADYVILLSHLGEQDTQFSSVKMIAATTGIDVVLDGHTHSVIQDSSAVNKDGKYVHFTQTGTQFANIGKLTISKNGEFHTELIPTSSISYTDNRVDAVYDSINKLVSTKVNEEIGTSNHILSIYDSTGNRIVNSKETTIGDFVADAYRYCMKADVGLCNGGGIRNNLPAGEITYENMVNINPFFNDMEARILTGKQLRQLLIESYHALPNEYGGFLQVSGLKVQIAIINGFSNVTDIQVEDKVTKQYLPLDENRTYLVAGSSYIFGASTSVSSCPKMTPTIMKDTEALKTYFVEGLHGAMNTHYLTTEGRININQ